jgi:hypothetical protein
VGEEGGGGVGGKGGGGGRGKKWPKPCVHIWIIKQLKKKDVGPVFIPQYCKNQNKKIEIISYMK